MGRSIWMYIAALSIILCLAFVFYEAKTRPAQPTAPNPPPLHDSKIDQVQGWGIELARETASLAKANRLARKQAATRTESRVGFLSLPG